MAWSASGSMRRTIARAAAAGASQFPFMTGARSVLSLGVLTILIAAHAALAAPAPVDQPVLDPATGSYFVVKEVPGTGTWSDADQFARSQNFQGRRGRLAVIKSKRMQDFLTANVKLIAPTWIGLRYECATGTSTWVDGHVISGKDFTYWHPQWTRNPTITCSTANAMDANVWQYMPVYLTSLAEHIPFRWQTTGPAKMWTYILVEFPPGPAK